MQPTGFSIAHLFIFVWVNLKKNSSASFFIALRPGWCGCSRLCSIGKPASFGSYSHLAPLTDKYVHGGCAIIKSQISPLGRK